MNTLFLPRILQIEEKDIEGNPLPPPTTTDRVEELVRPWAHTIKYQESGSIYYYSKPDLLRRFRQIFINDALVKKNFGVRKILIIDADALLVEDTSDWTHIFESHDLQADAYLITGMDSVLRDENVHILSFFEYIISTYPSRSFLFFFHKDFTHPDFRTIFEGKTFFKQSQIFHTLHSIDDTKQFIIYLQKKWNLEIASDVAELIATQCGGHFLLVKQAIRHLRDKGSAGVKNIFTHTLMERRLQDVWNAFLTSEQSVLTKIAYKEKKFTPEEEHSLSFLIKTGWIIKKKNELIFSIPLLTEFIARSDNKNRITCSFDGTISVNQVPVNREFSKKEQTVLQYFVNHQGKTIKRDTIALLLWGVEWEKEYSDWAIDQVIHRLRYKLKALHVKNTIATIRGEGFMMN